MEEYTSFLSSGQEHVSLFFVDDGSRDDTFQLLTSLREKFPGQVDCLRLEKNKGKAEAIRQGMLANLSRKADYLGFFDADLATPLTEIDWLMEWGKEEKKTGMVIGARVKLFGSTEISRYASRHYSGRLFATLVSNMMDLSLYDTQCGAKLFRKELVSPLFSEQFISRWLFDIELIYRLLQHTGKNRIAEKLVEVPLRKWTEKGESKISFFYLLKVPFELLRIYMKYRKGSK